MRRWLGLLTLTVGFVALSSPARAWIFYEHRDVGVAAWPLLSPAAQTTFKALWNDARAGYAAPLCPEPIASGASAQCIDLAAWPAIAGDHACSPAELVDSTLGSAWILDVLDISADVGAKLSAGRSEQSRQNVWNSSNLRLQSVDSGYVTRAGANNAHFLLDGTTGEDLAHFIARSARAGEPLNALGLYQAYHAAAVVLARAPTPSAASPRQRTERARRILSLEAFALHFLQDTFSSGHAIGTWGDAATRKGTHDYYSLHGVPDVTWSGRRIVMFGDAHIQPADSKRTAAAVAASLTHLYEALRTGGALGPVFGGYGGDSVRVLGQLAIAARIGYGLEGVVGFTNSGTMFLQAGVVIQNSQHDACSTSDCDFEPFGSAAIPRVSARVGLDLALRLPFWVLPCDLILLAPILALVAPDSLPNVAIQAASGGLVPWQRTFETPVGGFEAVLGRHIGVALFGVAGGRILGWASRTLQSGQTVAFQTVYRAVTLTFPVVEYTPFRTFSQELVAAMRIELAYAVDIPFDVDYWQQRGIPGPELSPAHMALIRLSIEGRDYL
jgi:hypothetical protein